MLVCSEEKIKKSKKKTILVTAVLTTILVSILTFVLCQGLPAKVYSTQHISLAISLSQDTIDEYASRFNTVHSTMVGLYKVPEQKADEYTGHILNVVYPDFPTAEDIMAVIKIESNWDENARSHADARGLMQVLHGEYQVQNNIAQGSAILREYYEILKNKHAAVVAYNVGIGSYQIGLRNEEYYNAYQLQLARIKSTNAPSVVANL